MYMYIHISLFSIADLDFACDINVATCKVNNDMFKKNVYQCIKIHLQELQQRNIIHVYI